MSKKLSVFTMSMTIWNERGELDEPGFRKHLARIRDAGASTYIGSSASGDAFAMSPDDWTRVLEIASQELKGRTGFRVLGPEPRSLAEVQRFIRLVEPHKPDALQIYALDLGHSVRPTPVELEAYYEEVLAGTDLDIVLSYFDWLGVPMMLDVIEKLADKYDNLVGFIYSSREPVKLTEAVLRLRDRLDVHVTGPWDAITALTLGATGFMGFEGNVSPELHAGVVDAFAAGDGARLRRDYEKLIRLSAMHMPYSGSSGRAIKPLLNRFGLPGGTLRPPRLPVAPEIVDELVRATLELDLPGFPKQTI